MLVFSITNGAAQAQTGVASDVLTPFARNPFQPQLPVQEEEQPPVKPVEIIKPVDKPKPVTGKTSSSSVKPSAQVAKPQPPPDLKITGLVWNTDRPQAIINGKVVDVGDKIETIQIVSINKNGIEIDFEGNIIPIMP